MRRGHSVQVSVDRRRYALQHAATDAGVPYQAVPEGGLSEMTKESFLRTMLLFLWVPAESRCAPSHHMCGINFRTLRWSVWMRRDSL